MGALPDQKLQIVRTLVETAPDQVVSSLQLALASAAGDPALADVRRLVENEAADRRLRNAVLSPVIPFFRAGPRPAHGLSFPPRALSMIWRGLKEEAPTEVAVASRALVDFRPDESSPEPFDDLVDIAAHGLRTAKQKDYVAAIALLDGVAPGTARNLLACLDLSPLVRSSAMRLPDWVNRMTEERATAARLAYRDAVDAAPDSGPRFFEMLAAQLSQPWNILRIISAVMDRPSERYLRDCELATFAERLMDEIDANLKSVVTFSLDTGIEGGMRAGALVELVTLQIAELEKGIELVKEGGWGGRIHKQKRTLADGVEGRLRDLEKVITLALPTQSVRIARMVKQVPKIIGEPDAKSVNRAMALLTFTESVRTSANYGGFASMRAKTVKEMAEMVDAYVEEVLALIKDQEVADPQLAGRYLEIAAEVTSLLQDTRVADIIRRRAYSALAISTDGGLDAPRAESA